MAQPGAADPSFHPFDVALRREPLSLASEGLSSPALHSLRFITPPTSTHSGPPSLCVLSFSQLESHRGSGEVFLDTHLEALCHSLGPWETPLS